MIILGLTGSIGMGKTTAAGMFRRLGVPVHEADAAVHRLLGPGGAAIPAIEAAFPGAVRNGAVDRSALGQRAFENPAELQTLEAILHPLVRRAERRFLARAAAARAPVVVLDIPLLFETGAERRCDATIVVTTSRFIQRARVLRRPGMTAERLAAVEARQMSDREKRRRADFVVQTGRDRRATLRALIRIVRLMHRRKASAWGFCTNGRSCHA